MMVVILGAAATVVALLLVPFRLQWHLGGPRREDRRAVLSWGFGLVTIDLTGSSGRRRSEGSRSRRKRRAPAIRRIVRVLRTPGLGAAIVRLIRRAMRAAHLRDVAVKVRISLEDPSDTGRLWGLVGPLSASVAGISGLDLLVEPNFEPVRGGEELSVESWGRSTVVPAQVLVVALSFAASPAALRAFRSAVSR